MGEARKSAPRPYTIFLRLYNYTYTVTYTFTYTVSTGLSADVSEDCPCKIIWRFSKWQFSAMYASYQVGK